MSRWRTTLALAAATLCVGACAVGPDYRAPRPDLPAGFIASDAPTGPPPGSGATDPARWWQALGDKQLNALVERAVRGNPDIGIALAHLQEARTFEALVVGAALPEVDAAAGAGRGTGSDLTRGRAPSALVGADNSAGLEHLNTIAGFESTWELDAFGKYRREYQAARAEAQAAAAARNGVLTAVIADVVRAYLDLRGLQTQAAVLAHAAAVQRESLRIVSLRYQQGITNELDVALASRELASLQARLRPLDAQVRAAQYTLATLLGEYPERLAEELSQPAMMPTLPEGAQAGTPLELLRRRPDIVQAERELAASTARVGVATANLFPSLALVGSLGAAGQGWGLGPDRSRHIWSFGPAALWPVLDFGALDAASEIAGFEARAQLLEYRKTLIGAVGEVDGALDAYGAERDAIEQLGAGLLAAQRAVDIATERYQRGLSDYLNVVDAQRQLYELQEQYVASQIGAADAFVQLYRSLGGGWEDYQRVPAARRPQPALVAMFRHLLQSGTP